jgi:hypothetical protein
MDSTTYTSGGSHCICLCLQQLYPAAPANICPLRAACFDIYLLVARCGVYVLAQHAQVVGEKRSGAKPSRGKIQKN